MFCRHGFTALGEVRLRTAQVGGQLNFIGATLANPGGRAVSALGLVVGQDMFCGGPFSAEGEIRMTGARIGGSLEFGGARLDNSGGYALSARGITVAQDLDFLDGFTAQGQVRLLDARIGGRLDFEGAVLANPGGIAADLACTVSTVMFLLPRTPPEGVIDLTSARTGSFHDDPASWPALIRLRGFAYDTLENEAVSLSDRLAWLKRSGEGYAPGPTTSWQEPTGVAAAPKPPAGSESPRNATAGPNCRGQEKYGTAALRDSQVRLPELAGRSLAGRIAHRGKHRVRQLLPGAHAPGRTCRTRLPAGHLRAGRPGARGELRPAAGMDTPRPRPGRLMDPYRLRLDTDHSYRSRPGQRPHTRLTLINRERTAAATNRPANRHVSVDHHNAGTQALMFQRAVANRYLGRIPADGACLTRQGRGSPTRGVPRWRTGQQPMPCRRTRG
jgi:hypothetical protein